MFNNKVVIKLFHSFFFSQTRLFTLHIYFKTSKKFHKKKNKITLFLEKKMLKYILFNSIYFYFYYIFVLFFKIILILTNYIFTE